MADFDIGYASIYLLGALFFLFIIYVFCMMCKEYRELSSHQQPLDSQHVTAASSNHRSQIPENLGENSDAIPIHGSYINAYKTLVAKALSDSEVDACHQSRSEFSRRPFPLRQGRRSQGIPTTKL